MILVDTSVWVDHLRIGDELLQDLLDKDQVLAHPLLSANWGWAAFRDVPQLYYNYSAYQPRMLLATTRSCAL